jgi:hypothetical protein
MLGGRTVPFKMLRGRFAGGYIIRGTTRLHSLLKARDFYGSILYFYSSKLNNGYYVHQSFP